MLTITSAIRGLPIQIFGLVAAAMLVTSCGDDGAGSDGAKPFDNTYHFQAHEGQQPDPATLSGGQPTVAESGCGAPAGRLYSHPGPCRG